MGATQDRHKNSIALKEKQLLERANGCKRNARRGFFQLKLFPVITVCIFLGYWFVLCPLVFHFLYNENISKNRPWPSSWSFVYWLVAFLVWLLLMLIFVLIWRSSAGKYTKQKSRKPKSCPKEISLESAKQRQHLNEDVNSDGQGEESGNSKGNSNRRAEPGENTDKESKRHKDLPPLVIHRRMSGNDVENGGIINVEANAATEDKESENLNPVFEKVTASPLSPRELFFIDLIREAEKVERNKESRESKIPEGTCFFPKSFSIQKKEETGSKETDNERKSNHVDNEASYFIANVESPRMEKSEVYLEVGPDFEYPEEWIVNFNTEKPVLILEQRHHI